MIIAAHQPNFLPWLGYFYKISLVDQFVLADDVQYTTHSFTNRNSIKTPQGKQWLTVPVLTKGMGLQMIKEVKIDPYSNWRRKHWKSLQVNYRYAPYFDFYAAEIDKIYNTEWKYLVDVNIAFIEFFAEVFGLDCSFKRSYKLKTGEGATERIIDMIKNLEGDEYISGPSGKNYLDESLFAQAGICLRYLNYDHPVYRQQFGEFIPNLSSIDLLFNEGPNSARILNRSSVKNSWVEEQS